MNLNIKTTNISLTPAISEYLEKKLGMLKKFIDIDQQNALMHVIIAKVSMHHKSGDVFKAEIDLHVGSRNFHAESEKEDLYMAIDHAKDDLVREIKTKKEKRISSVRRGAQKLKNFIRGSESNE